MATYEYVMLDMFDDDVAITETERWHGWAGEWCNAVQHTNNV